MDFALNVGAPLALASVVLFLVWRSMRRTLAVLVDGPARYQAHPIDWLCAQHGPLQGDQECPECLLAAESRLAAHFLALDAYYRSEADPK